jgi:hypothetical protein
MELDKKLSPPHGAGALPEEPYDCLWEDNQPPLLVRAMVSGGTDPLKTASLGSERGGHFFLRILLSFLNRSG